MVETTFCGPGAARVLARGGPGRVAAAFGGGGYLRMPGGYLLLAPGGSPRGPLSLVVPGLTAPRAQAPVAIRGASLRIGDDTISLARTECRRSPVRPAWIAVSARTAAERAQAAVAPVAPELSVGLAELARGSWAGGVRALAGLGEGLTPAGDDVLAGYAAWRWAAGAPVDPGPLAVQRCSPIGLAYLECAARGELPPFFDAVVAAVAAGNAPAAAIHARRADSWGASSGAALVHGLAAGAAGVAAPGREAA
jgi:hypothetical protein